MNSSIEILTNDRFESAVSGNVFAQKGVFAGFIQYPYEFVSALNYDNTEHTYVADGRAYLIGDSTNRGYPDTIYDNSSLRLPAPSSAWNGFTYDIIVDPVRSIAQLCNWLYVYDESGSDIYCYAFVDPVRASGYTITGGRTQITCMPRHMEHEEIEYHWAIILATGGINAHENSGFTGTRFMSTLLGVSRDTEKLVNKVWTYTGDTRPTNPSTGNTMYVKL